jgi:hypothetical protein
MTRFKAELPICNDFIYITERKLYKNRNADLYTIIKLEDRPACEVLTHESQRQSEEPKYVGLRRQYQQGARGKTKAAQIVGVLVS